MTDGPRPDTGRRSTLGPNDRAVLAVLTQAKGPLGAYEVLDQVRCHGLRAPPQVYRALNRLIGLGLAHRIESLNAFVACAHGHHADPVGAADRAMFVICDRCGAVVELDAAATAGAAEAAAATKGFRVDQVIVEMKGLCAPCADQAAGSG